jgi:hypothetical protein
VDSVDLSPLLLGTLTPEGGLRHELVIGAGPRESNLSSAPACSSYAGVPLYDESEGSSAWSDVSGRAGNCSTVVGLIIDEGKGGNYFLAMSSNIAGPDLTIPTRRPTLTPRTQSTRSTVGTDAYCKC